MERYAALVVIAISLLSVFFLRTHPDSLKLTNLQVAFNGNLTMWGTLPATAKDLSNMCESMGLNVSTLLRSNVSTCCICLFLTSRLINFYRTVQRAFSFEGKGLSEWQVYNVEKMYSMFGQGERSALISFPVDLFRLALV